MEYVSSEEENSSAILAYYRHIGGEIIMDLEVVNYGDDMIRFSPKDISYSVYMYRYQYDKSPDDGEWVEEMIAEDKVIDPEEMILRVDKNEARAVARNRTSTVLEGISGTMYALDDLSSVGSSTSTERAARYLRRNSLAMERAERRDQFYSQVSNLNEMRTYWETMAIRTTDLLPGESIAGEISIRNNKNARIYQVNIQIGNDIHLYRFFQRSYIP